MNITERYLGVGSLPKSKKARISNWGCVMSTPSKELCKRLGILRRKAGLEGWPEYVKETQKKFFRERTRETDIRGEIVSIAFIDNTKESKDTCVALRVEDFYVVICTQGITEEDD